MNSSNNQASLAVYDDFLQKHFVPPEFLSNLDVDLNNDNNNDAAKDGVAADDSQNLNHIHNLNYNHLHNHNYNHNHNYSPSHRHNHSKEELLLPLYETPNSTLSFSPQQPQAFDLSTTPQEYVNNFSYPNITRSYKQNLMEKIDIDEPFHQHLRNNSGNNNAKETEVNKNNKDLEKNILNSFLSLVKPTDQNKLPMASSVLNLQKNIKGLTKEFKCDQCSNSFTRKTRLKEHKNRIHLGKILRFECKFCGTVLSSRENLTRHQIVHTDKFKCDHCDKRFDRSYRFQRHLIKCNNNIIIS